MDNYIVSLKRNFGIHAIPIAKAVAKELGIGYYENSLLEKLEIPTLQRAIAELDHLEGADLITATENLFMLKSNIVSDLAKKESFLIVGKAADYVMGDIPNVIRININSNYEDCIKTVSERDCVSHDEAVETIRLRNAERATLYEKHTGCVWNDPLGFDLTLNSSRIGRERCARLIVKYVEMLREENAI